ncbi:MAG TPA: ABC transporter permease [Marmoricola sp.]|nr:ABC transporter permease [Marmoricola sp.]
MPEVQQVEPPEGKEATLRTQPKWMDWLPTVRMTLLSILVALVFGAILIAISDDRVVGAASFGDAITGLGQAVGGSYWAMLTGAVGGWDAIADTLVKAAPLICAGLGVTLAFRAGLFNIGGQGQLVLGAIFAGYVGFAMDLPPGIHLVVAVIAAGIGGALWGAIPGLLKAKTGAHEVITTIMLNYVAASLLLYLLSNVNAFQREGQLNPRSHPVDTTATFPTIFSVHTGVLAAMVLTAVVWWVLERTTLGFEMKAAGANPDAARTAGMNVQRLYVYAMTLAGLLAGLAAAMTVLGQRLSLTTSVAGSLGFDAITVALLGRATPLGTLLAGLLFGALDAGGVQMQAGEGTPIQLTEVIKALIVLFVAAPAVVRSMLHFKARRDHGETTMAAKGWGG